MAYLVCRFLHPSACLRHGVRAAHHSVRRGVHSHTSDRLVSHAHPALRGGGHQLCGRQRRYRGEGRDHSAGRGHQRRGGDALHQFHQHQQRRQFHHRHISDRLQPGHRGCGCPESRCQCHRAAAGGSKCDGRDHHQSQLQLRLRGRLLYPGWPLLARVPVELSRRLCEGCNQARARRRRCPNLWRTQICHARLA